MADLKSAAQLGYTEALEALRDELAASIPETQSAHGKAALAKTFLDTLEVLNERKPQVKREGTGLDEFTAALRAKRGSGAAS